MTVINNTLTVFKLLSRFNIMSSVGMYYGFSHSISDRVSTLTHLMMWNGGIFLVRAAAAFVRGTTMSV